MINKSTLDAIDPYITRDNSEIRELMHPDTHAVVNQSLAHASVPPGGRTLAHRHLRSEEIYYVLAGAGSMELGDEQFPIRAGDCVLIPPQTVHCVHNNGDEALQLLCACSPPYSHEDTVVID